MTGRVVERDARTAYSVPVRSTGVSPLMPPHSQGAERRREHRAGRTGSRWGLRALVIGGLAGAAWLLTGAAAHAADRHPAGGGLSLGSSLIGSVVHGDDHSVAVMDRALRAAVGPLEADHHRGPGPALALADQLAGTLDQVRSRTDADAALGGIDRVVRELTAPVHLGGEAVDTRLVNDPQELVPPQVGVAPVTPVRHSATPVTGSGDASAEAPAANPDRSEPDPAVAGAVAGQVGAAVDKDEKVPPAEPALDRWNPVGKTVARQHTFAAGRRPAAATSAEPETVSDTPGGDGPAPLRVHFGAANGVPASAPGSVLESGSAAFLPAKVADSTVACHRLPIAADVEVRRHDAEAPTVSPD